MEACTLHSKAQRAHLGTIEGNGGPEPEEPGRNRGRARRSTVPGRPGRRQGETAMKCFAMLLLCLLPAGAALAHGNNDHVRGTITELSAQSITVRTTANSTKT